jgi:two-component system chemotaxis response regulator CheB
MLVVADATSHLELAETLRFSGATVVGAASTAQGALAMLRGLQPGVVALDLDALGFDGLALLAQLARERSAQVVAFSKQLESSLLVRAVALGANEVIGRDELRAWGERRSRPSLSPGRVARPSAAPQPERSLLPRRAAALIAIGASTGGTVALTELLRNLPVDSPPIVIVQHMLAEFTRDFAERLNSACALEVRQADDGERLRRGRVLIACGGRHMRVVRAGDGALCVRLNDEAPVGMHRPSVDVLFHSCADALGPDALGVLLTGMGEDGAAGLLAMRKSGAATLVQDEASSACFGMPRAAIARGAAEQVLSLHGIGKLLRGE